MQNQITKAYAVKYPDCSTNAVMVRYSTNTLGETVTIIQCPIYQCLIDTYFTPIIKYGGSNEVKKDKSTTVSIVLLFDRYSFSLKAKYIILGRCRIVGYFLLATDSQLIYQAGKHSQLEHFWQNSSYFNSGFFPDYIVGAMLKIQA